MAKYREIMEQHIGRRLRSDELVHHINGDHSDDRLENLMVVSATEHARLHAGSLRFRCKGEQYEPDDITGPSAIALVSGHAARTSAVQAAWEWSTSRLIGC